MNAGHERREGGRDLARVVTARSFQRMPRAVDGVQRGRRQPRDHRIEHGRRRERILGSLQEEHRHRDRVEVLVAHAIGLARWMQRIAQEDQPGGRQTLGDGDARHAPAERLAADPDRLALGGTPRRLLERGDDGRDRDRLAIGRSLPGLHVREVAPQRGDALLGDRAREPRHERMVHARARRRGTARARRRRRAGAGTPRSPAPCPAPRTRVVPRRSPRMPSCMAWPRRARCTSAPAGSRSTGGSTASSTRRA